MFCLFGITVHWMAKTTRRWGENKIYSPAEMQQMLKGCIELYKQLKFKSVVFKAGTNAILKMQIQRLSSSVGLENISIID